MNFDPATLLTTAVFTLLLVGVMLAGTVRSWHREEAGAWWAAAFLFGGIGFGLFAWPAEPMHPLRIGANTLFLLACSFFHSGARALAGRKTLIWPAILALAGWPMLVVVAEPDFDTRALILSLGVSGYSVFTAMEFARGAKPDERTRLIASAICTAHGIFYLARAILGPALGLVEGASETTISVWGAIVALEAILFVAALGSLVVGASSERASTRERLAANTDFLTGIGNRRAFETAIQPIISDLKGDAPAVLLLLDLDNFKGVNDKLGHDAGDDFLKSYTSIVRKQLSEPDLFWRLGGDEFAIVLREPEQDQVELVKNSLRRAIDSCLAVARAKAGIEVSVSVGCAVMTSGELLPDLIRRGDTALYQEKRLLSPSRDRRRSHQELERATAA